MLTDHLEVVDCTEKDPVLVHVLSKTEDHYQIVMSAAGMGGTSGVSCVCQTFFRTLNTSCGECEHFMWWISHTELKYSLVLNKARIPTLMLYGISGQI